MHYRKATEADLEDAMRRAALDVLPAGDVIPLA